MTHNPRNYSDCKHKTEEFLSLYTKFPNVARNYSNCTRKTRRILIPYIEFPNATFSIIQIARVRQEEFLSLCTKIAQT